MKGIRSPIGRGVRWRGNQQVNMALHRRPPYQALFTIALFAFALGTSAQAGEVWKCRDGDRVVFSDVPCPTKGTSIDARRLQGNTMQAERAAPTPDDPARTQATGPSRNSAPPNAGQNREANSCPSDREIRDMETKASSITLAKREKEFLADEIRRARQCRKGQGTYSSEDWRVSREAQDAQNNLSGRQAARERAEGVHSAADPVEGDRIANKRAQEAAAEKIAEAIRRQQAEITISTCDARGCWTESGYFYKRNSRTSFFGPKGFCRRVGNLMECR